MNYEPEMARRFVARHYGEGGRKMRRCHPRDVLSHAIDRIAFERLPYQLTGEVLDHASKAVSWLSIISKTDVLA